MAATKKAEGSIALSCYGLGAKEVVPIARCIEEVGLDGIWVGEHVVIPMDWETEHPYPSPLHSVEVIGNTTELIDLWVAFAAMAAVTTRIFVASGVCILPLRHPLMTAQATSTLQRIADGRLIVGGGTGWFLEEFQALDEDFDDRGDRMDEIVEILRKSWAGGPFDFKGTNYAFESLIVTLEPTPIPLILGGATGRPLRRAAKWADGWRNPSSWTLEQCVEIRRRVRPMLEAEGRDPDAFDYHITMSDTTLESVERYQAAGFTHLSVPTFGLWRRPEPVPIEQKLDDIAHIAAELGLS